MARLTLPVNARFVKRTWLPPGRTQVNKSGWTGARQAVRLPGAGVWKVSAGVAPMGREIDVWPWRAFLTALEGKANTFLMPATDGHQWVHPSVGFAPYIDEVPAMGATQFYASRPEAGAGTKMFGGQYISVPLPSGKVQMLMLTQDWTLNSAGRGLMQFKAPLRETITGNPYVQITNPVCEMAMLTDEPVGWDENEGVWTVAFDAEEAF